VREVLGLLLVALLLALGFLALRRGVETEWPTPTPAPQQVVTATP